MRVDREGGRNKEGVGNVPMLKVGEEETAKERLDGMPKMAQLSSPRIAYVFAVRT